MQETNALNKENQKCLFCEGMNDLVIFEETIFCRECFNTQRNMMEEFRQSRTRFFPEIDKITDKIYLGNEDGQREKLKLKELGVTHILNCAAYLENFHPESFVYLNLEMDDSLTENLSKFLPQAFKFIEESEIVYIHCQAGISRSASIVIAYIMWKHKLSYENSYEMVKQARKRISPNSGFIKQLQDL